MLKINPSQLAELGAYRVERAVDEVRRFIADSEPLLLLDRSEADLCEIAQAWVGACKGWGIDAAPAMCELLALRLRWGSFDDAESEWVLAVCTGPMSGEDKVALGREPDCCAVADSPTDAGGLSYGKHQAAEKKGGLYQMLSDRVARIDPVPDTDVRAGIETHLAKFSKS